MEANSSHLIHKVAQNYLVCIADFPTRLIPKYLNVPENEQASLFGGLCILHTIIVEIYEHFSRVVTDDKRWEDRDFCYQAVEGPVKILWVIGALGQLVQGAEGLELRLSREVLDPALKKCGCREPVKAFGVLEEVGFKLIYSGIDGFSGQVDYKKCAAVALRYPAQNDSVLRALAYYTARLPEKKAGRKEKGVILEVLLRADFRPLLPDYVFHIPHLPATKDEAERTFSPATLEVWNALTGFMGDHYPQYRLYFRVPGPRNRRWVADYSTKDNDYGSWSIFVDEDGLSTRIVLIEGTINSMLERIDELSPRFQEDYLIAVACKDCIHCGKHVFYTHNDHVHRLCRSPWFISPHLLMEDLPDIERLIDFRLCSIN